MSEQYVKEVCLKAALKTRELDTVPSALLRDCLDVLLPRVTQVTNDSLSSGSFPTVFKSAIVRPLLKKPSLDPNCLQKYRPVSNLSFLSKITEKIVLSQLLIRLEKNNFLNPHQFAYRSGHST